MQFNSSMEKMLFNVMKHFIPEETMAMLHPDKVRAQLIKADAFAKAYALEMDQQGKMLRAIVQHLGINIDDNGSNNGDASGGSVAQLGSTGGGGDGSGGGSGDSPSADASGQRAA